MVRFGDYDAYLGIFRARAVGMKREGVAEKGVEKLEALLDYPIVLVDVAAVVKASKSSKPSDEHKLIMSISLSERKDVSRVSSTQ